jgi:hypothetical protein
MEKNWILEHLATQRFVTCALVEYKESEVKED